MSELPKGWSTAALGDIAAVIAGQSPIGSDVNDLDSGFPFFQGKAEFGDLYPTARKWTMNPSRLAQSGDVLLSVRAPVGPTNLAPYDCAIGRGLMAVRSQPGFADRYLLWAIRATSERLRVLATGSTFEAVTGPIVRAHIVTVAPTAEQERIVSAIEEAFSKLDAGDAGLRTIRQLLKRMRDAVLAAAITGRLVPQDPIETPTAEFSGDFGVDLLVEETLPPGWGAAPVGQLAFLVTDGDHRPPKRVASGVPHLTAKNVRGGQFDLAGCSYVDDAGFAQTRSRYEPLAGDVIVTCVGTIGRVAVVPSGLAFSADRNLAAVRFKPTVDARFARIAFESPRIQKRMAEASGSTAQPHLYLRDLRSIVLPVPPEEEQVRVVAEVERQFSFIDACERAVDAGLARSAALRRSVLKAAFDGRLVRQDPSDEPASVLLDRILAERALRGMSSGGRPRNRVEAS